jgi:hypothetical protein
MRGCFLALISTVVWSLPLFAQVTAQSACRASDAHSRTMLTDLKRLATSTDSVFVAQRTGSNLPATAASNVTLVTNSSTCSKAVTALNTTFATPGKVRQVYLFSFSSSFVTVDPTLPDTLGGKYARFVYSKQWALQQVWVSP